MQIMLSAVVFKDDIRWAALIKSQACYVLKIVTHKGRSSQCSKKKKKNCNHIRTMKLSF